MARYVDGFVAPVPKRNIDAYRRIARRAGKIWREYGALEYRECIADDVEMGKLSSLRPISMSVARNETRPDSARTSVKVKRGETVVFSWIVYKSRPHRDRVNEKVMKDPRIAEMDPKDMPLDMKRMIYGGFEVIVDV
jgi:uncharacterized protein YbaA (DUF1428 family)